MNLSEILIQFKGEIGVLLGAILIFFLNLYRESYQEGKKEKKVLKQLLAATSTNLAVFQENIDLFTKDYTTELEKVIEFPIYLVDVEVFDYAKNNFYFSSLDEKTIAKICLAFNRIKEAFLKKTPGNDCVNLTLGHLHMLITVTKNAKKALIKEL